MQKHSKRPVFGSRIVIKAPHYRADQTGHVHHEPINDGRGFLIILEGTGYFTLAKPDLVDLTLWKQSNQTIQQQDTLLFNTSSDSGVGSATLP